MRRIFVFAVLVLAVFPISLRAYTTVEQLSSEAVMNGATSAHSSSVVSACVSLAAPVIVRASDFRPGHRILQVLQPPRESQLSEITQLSFRLGS